MSRVGKNPIPIPDKVTVTCQGNVVTVKGPLGTLTRSVPLQLTVTVDGKQVLVARPSDAAKDRALHGLFRVLIANMVEGVVGGFSKSLDLVGVGYRAELKGKTLELALGFSHPVRYPVPTGITIAVDKQTRIVVSGSDKELVGETAAQIRRFRKPEPYNGKGVRYVGEIIRTKVGKSAAGAGASAGGGGK